MSTRRVRLTDRFLRDDLGSERAYDSVVPHLYARPRVRTGISFVVCASAGSKDREKVLGRYPGMTIDAARVAAFQWLIDQGVYKRGRIGREPAKLEASDYLSSGQQTCPRCQLVFDPSVAWAKRITVEKLFQHYFEDHVALRCRSTAVIRRNFERYFESIRRKPAEALTPYETQKWHNMLGSKVGPVTANRSLQLLKAILNFGIKWQLIDCRNPTKAVRRFKEESRDRIVQMEEMPILLDAIEKHATVTTRDVFKLCLYTSQRIQNVCSMRWQDIDIKQGTWRISATDFKTGCSHEIPLVPEAVQLLSARLSSQNGSIWVFPGSRNSSKPMKWCYKAWHRITEAAGLPGIRPHDLRRTHASYQAANGESLVTIARTLGHKDFKSTAIYTRLGTESIRAAMIAAVGKMKLGANLSS